MSFEAEMRRFEAEVNRTNSGNNLARPAGPVGNIYAASSTGFNPFRPHQQPAPQQHPPPQQHLETMIQGHIHARAGLPPPQLAQPQPHLPPQSPAANMLLKMQSQSSSSAGKTTFSAAPTSTAPAAASAAAAAADGDDDEEDIFAKLAAYEEEHKSEKKDKKKKKKDKKEKKEKEGVKQMAAKPVVAAAKPGPSGLVPTAVKAAQAAAAAKASQLNVPGHLKQPSKPFATSLPSTESQIARSSAPKSVSLVDRTIGAGPSATIKEESLVKAKKMKRVVRTGGGQMWEDNSLKDWDPNDFRIFAGDLGNDVTDEVLTRTFGRYPSFQRAKVIRDKKNNKTKGYGFVSFKDPQDFTRAIRELNGKYVGSRPIKLRKSNWKDRNIEVVRQKQKLKQAMGYKF